PTPVQIANAVNDGDIKATFRFDADEYNWPWVISEDGEGIVTSNKGKGYSYAILYADVEMKKDEVLSFEYKVDSEADHDYLHIFIDGDIVNGAGWSATDEWTEAIAYVADRDKTVEIAFAYQKDAADPEDYIGEDVARIKNLHLTNKNVIKTPVDIMRACAGGEFDQDASRYEHYVKAVKNENDGFWHVDTADGPIIYITLTQLTPWSNERAGNMTIVNDESYYNTLYYMTYFGYATGDADHNNFRVIIGDTDVTTDLQTYFEFQKHMEEPFYFLPVNDGLKRWAEAFVKDYERKNGYREHEDEWLEFCYYYDHYGSENHAHPEGDVCNYNYDPTEGLTIDNCYNAYEEGYFPADIANSDDAKTYNAETQRNKALINIPLARQNGSYYKFTAQKTGVYQVRSYTTSTQPELDEEGNPKTDKHGNIIYKSCASNGASPGLTIFNASGRQIGSAGEIRDRDAFLPENSVIYEGFNHYMTMTAGQTVYLLLETMVNDTAYYDFDITYKGETYEKMYIASTMPGVWSYDDNPNNQYYLAISTTYDSESGCYYKSDRSGNPSWDQPIYIDMIGESSIVSDYSQSNYKPLTWFVENNIFARRIKDGTGTAKQAKMREYLEAALSKDKDDPEYGLILADQEIVNILNAFIAANVDGGAGRGNGWLAFACYMEHFG
ncbi:MAG: hypothetical protein K2N14_04450, partial [Clostridia bacterium]|nr:hypothetical protein [Clostridia bacterium]